MASARAVDTEDDSDDQAAAPKGSRSAKKQAAKPAAETSAPADPATQDAQNADNKNENKDDEQDASEAGPTVQPDQAEAAPDKSVLSQVKREAQLQHPFTTRMNGWTGTFYGFAELDLMHDSTQSYVEGSLNTTLARPNTLAGDNPRLQMTARNSRVGFIAAAPVWNGIKASGVVEADFFGNQVPTGTQNANYTEGPLRMRLFYLKLETPIIDVIAGQDHDLFAWGGAGFYPNTPAFLPVLGEVYHRNPQIRVSKTLSSRAVDLEIAVAAVRPFDRDSGVPDGQAGLRLALNGWTGARTAGAGRPIVAPMAIGISGIGRRLSVADFSATPSNPQVANAGGFAADIFLPIIPAHGASMSNALSFSGELTDGTGIADLYPNLTGGVGFPQLPNPNNDLSVPTYTPNIDPGVATFDADSLLQTINWFTVVANIQYHLPINEGRGAWISATYSYLHSNNVLTLTPQAGLPYAWNKGQYVDGTLWIGLTPAAQIALSGQWTQQTFGDGVKADNVRGEGSFYFFF